MAHGPENVALDFPVCGVQRFQHGFDFHAFGNRRTRTRIFEFGKLGPRREFFDEIFVHERQRPDDIKFPFEKRLHGKHCADFSRIAHVQEQGFDDVVLVMAECEFAASEFVGNFEKAFSAQPGAQETRIFAIFRTVPANAVIGSFDPERIPRVSDIFFEFVGETTGETRVNMDRKKRVRYPDTPQPFDQYRQKRKTVLAAGKRHEYSVSVGYHPIRVERFSDRSVYRFVCAVSEDIRHTAFQKIIGLCYRLSK